MVVDFMCCMFFGFFVLFGEYIQVSLFIYVMIDNCVVVYIVIEYLIVVGCCCIGFVGCCDVCFFDVVDCWYIGYWEVLDVVGILVDFVFIVQVDVFMVEEGVCVVGVMVVVVVDFDGIVCLNDLVVFGVLVVLQV